MRMLLSSAALIVAAACASCAGPQISSTAAPVPQTTAADASPKYTFVLVHGAWAGGFEWKNVGDRLLKDGHYVERPTMTGMGERSHLANPDIDLNTHITDIVNVILFDNLHDVVLMGHSYGGMVITGVVDRVPDRIKCVIYVDAFLPEDGESLDAIAPPGGPNRVVAVPGFIGAAPRAGARPPYNVPQPAKTLSQPVSLKNQAAVAKIPTVYILTVDPGKKPEDDRFYQSYVRAQKRGWFTETIEAGHVVQTEKPAELVKMLEAAPTKAKAQKP